MDDHIRLCDDKKIVAFIADLYEKAGVDRETAELHGVGLVEASLRGVDSHGIMRTAAYFERYRKKAINVDVYKGQPWEIQSRSPLYQLIRRLWTRGTDMARWNPPARC